MSAARPKTRRQRESRLSLSKRYRPRTLPAARLILPFAIIRRRAATYTSPSWGYSLGPYTAGSAPRRVIGSPTRRSRSTFRCPAGSTACPRDRGFGGAPYLRHADAPHGDPRRGGARDSSVL